MPSESVCVAGFTRFALCRAKAVLLESETELGPVAQSGLTAAQEAEETKAETEAKAKEVAKAVDQ